MVHFIEYQKRWEQIPSICVWSKRQSKIQVSKILTCKEECNKFWPSPRAESRCYVFIVFFVFYTHLGYSFNFTVSCHCQVMGGIPPPSRGIVGENRSTRVNHYFPDIYQKYKNPVTSAIFTGIHSYIDRVRLNHQT